MSRIKTLKVLAFARFQATLMALVGLLFGVVYAFGGVLHDVFTTGSVNLGTALAFLALLGMPVVFALGGLVLGVLEAGLFNLIAGRLGGVKNDFLP